MTTTSNVKTPETASAFYVTVRNDNGDYRALLGPYETHDEALANVERGNRMAQDSGDPRAWWYAYGTAKIAGRVHVIFGA